MTIYDQLREPPFSLDETAIAWVRDVYASLSLDEKIGQLFTLIMIGTDEEEVQAHWGFAAGRRDQVLHPRPRL